MDAEHSGVLVCGSCLRDNMYSPATVFCLQCSERLCGTCNSHHKRNKASSSHTIQGISDAKDVEVFDTLKRLTQCSIHAEKKIKYLCKDHDQLCCNECAIVKHRKCEDVVSLAEEMEKASQNVSASTENVLKELNTHADILMLREASDQAKVDNTKETCTKALETLKKNMEAAYKELEDKITMKARIGRDTITKSISAQKTEIQTYQEKLNITIQKLETVKRLGNPVHMYLTEREMRDELNAFKQKLKDLRWSANSKELVVKETSSTYELVTCLQKFIKIDEKTTANVFLPHCDIKGIRVPCLVKNREYPLKLGKESFQKTKGRCVSMRTRVQDEHVSGCIWLNHFLVVAMNDKTDVLIDIRERPDLIQTRVQHKNDSIFAKVDDRRIAVCFNENYYSRLQLYQLDPTQRIFECTHMCTVNENIIGLTFDVLIQALVVLSYSGLVHFLSLDGEQLESFQLRNMKTVLKWPGNWKHYHVVFESDSKILYVTDGCILIATTMKSCTVFEYKIIGFLVGSMVLDNDGYIYLPMIAEGQSIIEIISPKGKIVRTLQVCTCAVKYMTLCFNTKMDEFALLCDEPDKELKIFHIRR